MEKPKIHERAEAAWSKEGIGATYDIHRPDYHDDTITYIHKLIQGVKASEAMYDVVELGAGTGKFTRKMFAKLSESFESEKQLKYLAIEPMSEMVNQLKESITGDLRLEVKQGQAETVDLPDNSVKCVVCAQCFHWFANEKAINQIHRILAPSGILVLVYNLRDLTDPTSLISRMNDIESKLYEAKPTPRHADYKWFGVIEDAAKRSMFTDINKEKQKVVTITGDQDFLVNYMSTISVTNSLEEDKRREILQQIRDVIRIHPESSGKENITIPFQTEIYYCYKK